MIYKKILSALLCATLLFSGVAAAKTTFSDVEDDPGVEWAKEYINTMADMGYIKGYEDGTFKPQKTISKTEALILMARMVGVDNEEYADSVKSALKEFEPVLDGYNTKYPEEIAFLLYTGILHPSDLGNFISNTNKNEPLKRYEAAILLTKLLGAEEEVLSNTLVVSLAYADTSDIPVDARPYVEYVNEQEIMQGMGDNEDGKPVFCPNEPVTRAQMAKILFTLIEVLDVTTQNGLISEIDEVFGEYIVVSIDGKEKNITVADRTVYKINGGTVEFEDLCPGMSVRLTYIAGVPALVENYVVLEDTVLYGLVSGTRATDGTRSITIADANDKTIVETFVLSEDAKIRVNGAIDVFTKIKKNNYVSLTIEDGLVTSVEVIDKNATVYGTLTKVDITGEFTVLSIEENSGEVKEYEVSADGVVVSRNNLDSKLSELMEGDAITLKLTYGKVTKLSASSKNQNISGKISTITHTINGTTIEIDAGKKSNTFKVNKSVSVLINSTDEGTVYDLRPGTDVSITVESNEITSIKAAGAVIKSQITGTIVNINVTYGLIVINENGTDYNVFCNSSTNIIDGVTAKTMTLKNVEKGRTATVTGSNASGVLEATAIVLY